MSSRRVLKAAQAIREVVSMAIIADLKDPRIADVTVTLVEVSPDMRNAKVNVSVMGDETKQNLCIRGLQSSAGYLQQKVGKRIDTRYTPRLQFVLDEGLKHSMIVTRILDEVLPKERETAKAESDVDESAETESPENGESESEAEALKSAEPAHDSSPATESVNLNTPGTETEDQPTEDLT